MIALDTNLWARAILGDDPRQSRAAQKAITEAAGGVGIFIPLLVFVELAWVLKAAPGWDAARVHDALGRLLNMEGVEVEASPLAREALALSTGAVRLADNLVFLAARGRGCSKLLTFDARLAKTGRAVLLKI
ncbi:MAG: type II toxin-antitoxin system VapC family toxin [Geothrix sp.]|nr:type II toxin-antitoxin system VapC family toxin [Geothrix sp.]